MAVESTTINDVLCIVLTTIIGFSMHLLVTPTSKKDSKQKKRRREVIELDDDDDDDEAAAPRRRPKRKKEIKESSSSIMKNLYTKEHEEALKAKIEAKKEQYKDYYYGGGGSSSNSNNELYIAKQKYEAARKHTSDIWKYILNSKCYDISKQQWNEEEVKTTEKVFNEDLPKAIKKEKKATKRLNDIINSPNNNVILPIDARQPVILHYLKNFFGRGINELNAFDTDSLGQPQLDTGVTPIVEAMRNADVASMIMLIEYYPLYVTGTNNQNHQGNDSDSDNDNDNSSNDNNNNKPSNNILDINTKNREGNTALHHVVLMRFGPTIEDYRGLIQYLIQNNANVNATNDGGVTPLHLAVCYDPMELVTYLIESCNADFNRVDFLGRSPLFIAISKYLNLQKIQRDQFLHIGFLDMENYHRDEKHIGSIISYLLDVVDNNRFYMLHHHEGYLGDGGDYFQLCINWNEYIHHNGRTVIAKILKCGQIPFRQYRLVPVDSSVDTSSNNAQCFLPTLRCWIPQPQFVNWRLHSYDPIYADWR